VLTVLIRELLGRDILTLEGLWVNHRNPYDDRAREHHTLARLAHHLAQVELGESLSVGDDEQTIVTADRTLHGALE
jgi:hypothetical protein